MLPCSCPREGSLELMRASIVDLLESLLVTWFILSRLWNWNYNYWKQFGFVWLVEHSCHAFLLLARKAEKKVMQCHRKMVCICECVCFLRHDRGKKRSWLQHADEGPTSCPRSRRWSWWPPPTRTRPGSTWNGCEASRPQRSRPLMRKAQHLKEWET